MPDLASKLDLDERLHPIAKAILKGEQIKSNELKKIKNAGGGGQGDILFLNNIFVVKKYVHGKKEDDGGKFTETACLQNHNNKQEHYA